MSVIGRRVGPFEIVAPAALPGPGPWFVGERPRPDGTAEAALIRFPAPRDIAAGRALLAEQHDVLSRLQDPRIPRVYGLIDNGNALAIEHISGMPLTGCIFGRRVGDLLLTPVTLLDLMLELADALTNAHNQRVHHGHLDPDHVWLTESGELWILGFGDDRNQSQPARWTSPERARGWPLGTWTDQWGLAAVASSLISGLNPWSSNNPEAEARHADPTGMVAPVSQQWPALGILFRRMLAPDPRDRFPSMLLVRQELMTLARQAGGTSDRDTLGSWLSTHGPFDSVDDTHLHGVDPTPAYVATDAPTQPLPPVESTADDDSLRSPPSMDFEEDLATVVMAGVLPPVGPGVCR